MPKFLGPTHDVGGVQITNVGASVAGTDASTQTQVALKANSASPTLTGTVVVPDATAATSPPSKQQLDRRARQTIRTLYR